MTKYISKCDNFKTSVIYTRLSDIETVYNNFKRGDISEYVSISIISRLLSYLKGFLFGLDINHLSKIIYVDGHRCEYISFYNCPSRSVKYSLCICLEPNNFNVKYSVKRK